MPWHEWMLVVALIWVVCAVVVNVDVQERAVIDVSEMQQTLDAELDRQGVPYGGLDLEALARAGVSLQCGDPLVPVVKCSACKATFLLLTLLVLAFAYWMAKHP